MTEARAPITIGSLFSGIGGLELGLEAAFVEAGIHARVAWQVEQDAYCRAVLARHWPNADRSVIDVRAAGLHLPRVDVLCGGPPCQDISGAGKQEGLSGERSGLLFEYIRIVRELRPAVCIAENVYGGSWRTWVDAIRCGLAGAGYTVRVGKLLAADVGAPHERARIFVVAYAHGAELRQQPRGIGWTCRAGEALARGGGEALGDANREGLQRPADGQERAGDAAPRVASRGRDELQAQPRLGRAADGLPGGVDLPARWPAGRGEEQHAWEPPRTVEGRQADRRPRLKALGNAVVPACALDVGRELVVPAFS